MFRLGSKNTFEFNNSSLIHYRIHKLFRHLGKVYQIYIRWTKINLMVLFKSIFKTLFFSHIYLKIFADNTAAAKMIF